MTFDILLFCVRLKSGFDINYLLYTYIINFKAYRQKPRVSYVLTENNENMNINDMSQGINEKFDELNIYKTVIMELVNCGEISLVRKIMRINFELASKIDIKLLNKKVKES